VVKRQLSRHPRNQALLLSSSSCIVFWPGVIDPAAVDAVVAAEGGIIEEDAFVEEGWDDVAALLVLSSRLRRRQGHSCVEHH